MTEGSASFSTLDPQTAAARTKQKKVMEKYSLQSVLRAVQESYPSALRNLGRNKTRTALTMIGIAVGIAAVLSMITLGQFTKSKFWLATLNSASTRWYFYGYPNWNQKAIDVVPVPLSLSIGTGTFIFKEDIS